MGPYGDENERALIVKYLKHGKQVGVNDKIISRTIDVRKNNGLKIPDAIIVASAVELGCDLYTSDKEIISKIDFLRMVPHKNLCKLGGVGSFPRQW